MQEYMVFGYRIFRYLQLKTIQKYSPRRLSAGRFSKKIEKFFFQNLKNFRNFVTWDLNFFFFIKYLFL